MASSSAMAMYRTPSYFVWSTRKHASSSPRHSTPRSRKSGMTSDSNMNAKSAYGLQDESIDGMSGRDGGGEDSGPSPSKMRSPRPRSSGVGGTDTQSVDTRLSGVSGESDSHTLSTVSISPKHKDPDRIKKDREREERVRIARERLEEERKKKLVELQEQQRQAQENREKQLEMRRQKIEDLRRRDTERRAAVEERRKAKEDADRNRRETLLIKAEERVARYEQWRRTGQKGGRSHCLGFGSATPRAVCQPMERPRRSSSHSALMRRSPNGSDSDYSFRPQRRALSACSTIRRHCCVDINRMGSMPTPKHLSVSTSVLYHKRNTDFSSAGMLNISSRPDSLVALGQPPSRPKSVMTLSGSSTGSASSVVPGGGVRLRDTKTPRKPRPASVATSMPSFVAFEPARPSPRSKSSDRLARERSKTRGRSARQSAEKESEKVEEDKEMVKTEVKTRRTTIDRLSTPKQSPTVQGKETTPAKRESPVRISPRKAFSTSNLTMPRKKPSVKEKPAKEAAGRAKHLTPTVITAAPEDAMASPATPARPASPAVTAAHITTSTPTSTPATGTPTRVRSPVLGADEDGGSGRPSQTTTPGSAGEITAEEYKAKLAEKRRQAREKAEREAEEERRRQEDLRQQEEERRRQEEEEQRRLEEEALRLAEEARQAEEERLRKAIEAEEQRRAEEAARLEQEKLAKEELERKAKEEAERLEQERLEKARREEEERQERKKRLEMIMKRVKTDTPAEGTKETPTKAVAGSPTKSAANSSDSSPVEPEGKGVPEAATGPYGRQDEEGSSEKETLALEESQPAPSALLTTAPSPAAVGAKEPASALATPAEADKGGPSYVFSPSTRMSASMYSPVAASIEAENGGEKPRFKSPLLQKLAEEKEEAGAGQGSGGTRFKSPLLQNLLGKTKVGARIGIERQDHSMSTPDLSRLDRNGASGEPQGRGLPAASETMSASMVEMGGGDASSRKEVMNSSEEKDVDTSEDSSSSSHSSPSHSTSKSVRMVANGSGSQTSPLEKTVSFLEPVLQTPANGTEEAMDVSGTGDASAHVDMVSSGASFWSEQDSGASFGSDTARPGASASPLQVSLNGHGLLPHLGLERIGLGLEDSSISMRSVESGTTSITDSAAGSIFSSVSSLQQSQVQSLAGDRDFEEVIDLTINNKTSTSIAAEDLINFNKFEEMSERTASVPPPLNAFEEPSTPMRCQDVKDFLS